MNETLDPTIKNLASAIKRQESSGSKDPYNAKGASGEFGAYQFMPDTYKMWAKQYLGDENAKPTIENQNKIAYKRIKEWKEQGLNPAQIAAAWNAGEGSLKDDKWKTNVGVNSFGVKYDTPLYVKNVSKYYQELKGSTPEEKVTPENFDYGSIEEAQAAGQQHNGLALVKDFGNALTEAPMVLGGGVLNAVTQAVGGEAKPTYTSPLGTEQNALGYRDGQELGAWDTAKQGAGALAEGLSYGIGGGAIPEAAQFGKASIGAYVKPAVRAGVQSGALQGFGSSLQKGDSVPVAVAKGAGTSILGGVLGGGLGLGGAAYNKLAGFSPKIFNELDDAVRAGDDVAVSRITSSPEYQQVLRSNKYDDKAVEKSIKNIKNAIDDGIDRSYGVSKLTRAEKAEALTDDGITAMLEHMQNTKNPIADTKMALENKANDLMDEALNPILNKIRDEKLALVPLDRKSLLDDFNSRLDKTYMTDMEKERVKSYVKELLESQNKGNDFGIVDAGIIRRNANFDFVNDKNKGAVARLLGNTMRDALDMAEKNATSPQAKKIIAHINAVNKEYSRLMQGVDVVNLMARFPGQKGSELLNKAAGFFGAGTTGGNPLAYFGAHRLTNQLQNLAIRSKNNALFGDLSGKAGTISSSELIGNAKRILNNVDDIVIDNTTKTNNAINKENAVNKLLQTISPKTDSKLPVIQMGPKAKSKFNVSDPNLPTIAYGAAPFGVTGIIDKIKGLGKETYQREPEPQKDNTEELAAQIANAETRGEKEPYSTWKWSNRKLGKASPLGKDLGKYQITSARLREKSEAFLGKKVTDKEFLDSPELQDKFIREQIKWQKSHGMSDEEILATHRRGWGNLKPEQIRKAVATSSEYIEQARVGK